MTVMSFKFFFLRTERWFNIIDKNRNTLEKRILSFTVLYN